MEAALEGLNLAGTVVFAVSGALAAARKRMDLFGFGVLATVTGIGGGTLRDLFLGVRPVGWVDRPYLILLCAATALLAFLIVPRLASSTGLLWADAAGLALFAVTGTQQALALGAPPITAVLMGMLTASGGGMLRDVLSGEIPLILHREIYALAAILGGAAYWGMTELALPSPAALGLAALLAFALRGLGIRYRLALPAYSHADPLPDRGQPS